MKILSTLFVLCFSLLLQASALTQGMSIREVEKELGKPESQLSAGEKEILNYPGDGKLEFVNGQLQRVNGVTLAPAPASSTAQVAPKSAPKAPGAEPIFETVLPVIRDNQTITQSIQQPEASVEDIANGNYDYSKISKDLEKSISELGGADDAPGGPQTENKRLASILIGFIIEVVITVIVLKIAFQMVGFPALWQQLILLSLSVALASAIIAYVLHVGPLNPVSTGVSFLLLLVLIRPMTDVREWATAIQIAIAARVASIILMWLAFAGAMVLFGL